LAAAGDRARGGTAYVTLEPCAHHGATPPCADALVRAGIARVVAPFEDPDPRVSGRGFAALRAGGVAVETGIGAAEAASVNAGFLLRQRAGRPLLTLKLAMTLDGRIATGAGESRWITGGAARRRVHLMRATHDAVLIGAGTARADDPMLDVRDLGRATQPVRLVADGALSLPLDGRLAATARAQPLWLLHRPGVDPARAAAWEGVGARLLEVAAAPGGELDPAALLSALGAAGLTRVLCEGGGRLAAALLRAGVVDRLAAFTAGRAIGGDGVPGVGALGLSALADAPAFERRDVLGVGPDVLTVWERPGLAADLLP
ncbi:MAG: bifunctional diaminohydroxyphosphoribosylaminopyrimidine deaminase/5-amino-6-(5-phosphoribosylamino)uracil reductase RibD, partial [Pseudomonadota bacterium]